MFSATTGVFSAHHMVRALHFLASMLQMFWDMNHVLRQYLTTIVSFTTLT